MTNKTDLQKFFGADMSFGSWLVYFFMLCFGFGTFLH